jgi:hypothetical protein
MDSTLNRINMLKAIANRKWGADILVLRKLYLGCIRSKITYACEVWGGIADVHLRKLQ